MKLIFGLFLSCNSLALTAMHVTLDKISIIRHLAQQSNSYISRLNPHMRLQLAYFCATQGYCTICRSLILTNYQHFCTVPILAPLKKE